MGEKVPTIAEIEYAYQSARPIARVDPTHARMEFPLTGRFYPLGFPLDLSTNSEEVLDAAEESWGAFGKLFETAPLEVQVGVLEGPSAGCPPAPQCLVQRHLFSFVADQQNYGITDMSQSFSAIWLTKETVRYRSYLRYCFLECAAITQFATRYATGIHAGCVARKGVGVLLCGDSGAGKSTLSYACAKAGWTYVSDDSSFVLHDRDDLRVVGNCSQIRFRPSARSIFPEIEGGKVTQRSEATKPSIELSTAEWKHIQRSPTADVRYIVFLNRRDSSNLPLRTYSREVARQVLSQGRFSPLEMMPRHYENIHRLLRAPVLELRYRDLDWAIEQLEALVERGHP